MLWAHVSLCCVLTFYNSKTSEKFPQNPPTHPPKPTNPPTKTHHPTHQIPPSHPPKPTILPTKTHQHTHQNRPNDVLRGRMKMDASP